MNAFVRFCNAAAMGAQFVSGLFLAAIVAINTVNVFGRYVLSKPISWAEEGMLYLMIGAVFLSFIKVTHDGAHIRMEVLLRALPLPLRRALLVFNELVLIGVALTVVWVGVPIVLKLAEFDQRSDALGLPVFIPHGVIPLGFALAAVLLASRLLSGATVNDPGSQGEH